MSLLYLLAASIASYCLRCSSPLLEARMNDGLLQQSLALSVLTRAEGLTLVTRNTRHFDQVPGLQVVDWMSEPKARVGPKRKRS